MVPLGKRITRGLQGKGVGVEPVRRQKRVNGLLGGERANECRGRQQTCGGRPVLPHPVGQRGAPVAVALRVNRGHRGRSLPTGQAWSWRFGLPPVGASAALRGLSSTCRNTRDPEKAGPPRNLPPPPPNTVLHSSTQPKSEKLRIDSDSTLSAPWEKKSSARASTAAPAGTLAPPAWLGGARSSDCSSKFPIRAFLMMASSPMELLGASGAGWQRTLTGPARRTESKPGRKERVWRDCERRTEDGGDRGQRTHLRWWTLAC